MIRHATENDIENILKLGKELHNESPVFNVYKWNDEKAKRFVSELVADEYQCGILAYDGDELVGMILGRIDCPYFSTDCSLVEHFIYIQEDRRGSMIGYRLIKEWLKWGSKYNVKDTWLDYTTGIGSGKTTKFFKKLGFKEMGIVLRRD